MKFLSLPSMRRSAATFAGLVLASQLAWAIDPFTVRDIRVEGLQRVEPGTVFASIPIRVGENYTDAKAAAAIRALFGLGLFSDVRIDVAGDVVVVIVEERPTVAEIDFSGMKEFDKDTLRRTMRDIGLVEGRPFDKAVIDRAEQELKRQYVGRSLFATEIVTTVTPTERNRVNLSFAIFEGAAARISSIRFVGNKVFSESTLQDLFELDSGGWLAWYTKSNRYSRAKLNADLETLRSYYLARGYLDFRIDSTQVAISPDRQDITITINVTEGDQFVVQAVRLEGNYLAKEDDFKALVSIRVGQPYNADQVAQTTKAFTEAFGNAGFAFANVEARPEFDRTQKRVVVVLNADPSRRAYVRRILIAGNSRTRDEVIRREFRQFEASWYDGERIRLSRDRVDRLGFFSDVSVETQDVPGTQDQVDLVVKVAEKRTGSVQLGAAISSAEKLGLSFGIKEENAFGSGNYLGVDINTSKFNRTIVLNSTNPYFTADGVSRSFDVYHRSSRPYNDQGGNYRLVTSGGSVRFGVPFTEIDTVYFGGGLERTSIRRGTNIPAAYLAYADRFGFNSNSLPLTVGWSRDDRDSALAPNKGRLQRLNGEWGVAGDARYMRGSYQYQEYFPLSKQYTFAINGELGLGRGQSGRPFPVFKNFYSGGLGSVRGFEQGTLGPRDVTGFTIGGAKKVTLNAELLVPFPGAGNDRTLRMFGFVDVGNVFGEGERIRTSELRSSAGIGVSWISPVGPLRFALAQPLRKFAGDRIQKLQFQIGTSF